MWPLKVYAECVGEMCTLDVYAGCVGEMCTLDVYAGCVRLTGAISVGYQPITMLDSIALRAWLKSVPVSCMYKRIA